MTETGLPSIGARFRAAREESGLTLRQIADATKLTVRVLEAIETDRVSQLPGGIYRRAIVRSFAREIRLDPEVMLREFLAQYPDDLPPLPPLPLRKATSYDLPVEPDPPPTRSRLWRSFFGVVGALVPIGAGIFYFTIALRGNDARQDVANMLPTRTTDQWGPHLVPAAGFVEAPPSVGHSIAVMITVSSRCDLQVLADGRQVVSRTVVPGELVELAVSDEVVLSGTDAGAVHVSLNGQAGRRLGEAGSPLNARIGRDNYDSWLVR